jgi:hypothetical protein
VFEDGGDLKTARIFFGSDFFAKAIFRYVTVDEVDQRLAAFMRDGTMSFDSLVYFNFVTRIKKFSNFAIRLDYELNCFRQPRERGWRVSNSSSQSEFGPHVDYDRALAMFESDVIGAINNNPLEALDAL